MTARKEGEDRPAEEGIAVEFGGRRARPGTREELNNARAAGQEVEEFDLLNPEHQKHIRTLLGEAADMVGEYELAAQIQGRKLDDSLKAKLGRVANTNIKVWHVAVFTVGATLVWVAYEGIAYAFDWDLRLGLFGDKNSSEAPMASETPARARRAA